MHLILTRSFPPELGGMQSLMWGLSRELSKNFMIKVFADYIAHHKEFDDQASFSIERVGGIKLLRKYRKAQLINEFINRETAVQPEAPGASATLRKFSAQAEIVILTNVPVRAYSQRIKNLSDLSMNYPIITNSGLKGPALAELTKLTKNHCVFIDDNPFQIDSAAKHTPEIYRFHFTACKIVKKTMPYTEGATHRPTSWSHVDSLLTQILR